MKSYSLLLSSVHHGEKKLSVYHHENVSSAAIFLHLGYNTIVGITRKSSSLLLFSVQLGSYTLVEVTRESSSVLLSSVQIENNARWRSPG